MTDQVDNNTSKKTSKVNYFGVASSIIYITIIIVFGVPLWWTTTSPLRHSLPDVSGLLVHSQQLVHQIPICIVALDNTIDRNQLRQQLLNNLAEIVSSDGSIMSKLEWKVRPALAEELKIFDSNNDLSEIDKRLNSIGQHDTNGKVWVYLLPSTNSLFKDKANVLTGRNRFIYVQNLLSDKHSLFERLSQIIKSMIGSVSSAYNKDLLIYPEIDIIVNIAYESNIYDQIDEKVKTVREISGAFVKQSGISQLFNVNIITQIVHYAISDEFIASNLLNTSIDESDERRFDVNKVPQLLNAVESRVVEHNNKQSYHILLYLPSSNLLFYDSKTQESSNLIITRGRGGIIIWNEPNDFLLGFRAFIRNLIGLSQNTIPVLTEKLFFTKLEFDDVMRRVSQTQLQKTLTSLESISKLIHKVGNIVIQEEIAQRMHTAVELSHQSINHLAEGKLLQAFKLSTKAYLSSETAFFDPSLLALLYFPDDQKYAVYFPLFLPVSLPVFSSLYYLIKAYRNFKAKSD